MLSSFSPLEIAFVLGGKVCGAGVKAPLPDHAPDDCALTVTPNQAGDDYNAETVAHRDYVEEQRYRTIAASVPATPPRPRSSPDTLPIDFSKFTKLRSQPANWIEEAIPVKVVCIEQANAPPQSPRRTRPVADRFTWPTMRTWQQVQ